MFDVVSESTRGDVDGAGGGELESEDTAGVVAGDGDTRIGHM